MRKCRLCGITKPLEDFYAHPNMKEGHDSKCKECAKAIVHSARNRRPEYYREFDRQRGMLPHRVKAREEYAKTENGKAHINYGKKAWSKRNPDAKFASTCITNAVRDGRMFKPLQCSVCGKERLRIHGHHNDYSKPFEVIWMCHRCHRAWHKENEPIRIQGF